MGFKLKFLFFYFILMLSGLSHSSEIYDANVVGVYVHKDFVAVRTEGGTVVSEKPACATAKYSLAFSTSNTEASMMLSLLLAAKVSQTKVRILGDSSCSASSNKETVTHVMLTEGPT